MITSGVAGFTTALALILVVGAQNAFVLRQGLLRQHVLTVVVICAASDALLIAAGVAGLGTVVADNPYAAAVARWGGVAFLVGYAVLAAARAVRPTGLTPADRPPATLRGTVLACLAFTYLNPHVYLDTVLLLGSVAHQQPYPWLFGAGAALGSAIWFSALGAGARWLAPWLARPAAWRVIDAVVAVLMLAVAARLAVG